MEHRPGENRSRREGPKLPVREELPHGPIRSTRPFSSALLPDQRAQRAARHRHCGTEALRHRLLQKSFEPLRVLDRPFLRLFPIQILLHRTIRASRLRLRWHLAKRDDDGDGGTDGTAHPLPSL